jgi:hypothetical protein
MLAEIKITKQRSGKRNETKIDLMKKVSFQKYENRIPEFILS